MMIRSWTVGLLALGVSIALLGCGESENTAKSGSELSKTLGNVATGARAIVLRSASHIESGTL